MELLLQPQRCQAKGWQGSVHVGTRGCFCSKAPAQQPQTLLQCLRWPGSSSLPPSPVAGAAEAKGSSKLLSTLLWLCGMERRQEGTEGVPKPEPPPVASLEEKPLVKHILNVNLLLCVCAGVFLWAYFA